MPQSLSYKPSYDEWMYWVQTAINRLTTITEVYSKPPHIDAYMPENARQEKNAQAADMLRRLHTLTDASIAVSPQKRAETEAREEQTLADLQYAIQDLLNKLPAWSSDMQMLLKSPWYDNCAGQMASTLFRGLNGHLVEGIGSGHVEHGRLPEQLQNLMDRERIGDMRQPSAVQPKGAGNATLKRPEIARRWARQTTGGVE